MPAPGRIISYLEDKVGICARLLTEVGDIKTPDRKLLAECIGIPETTFNTAVAKGSLTTAVERKLTEKMGFSADEPSWCAGRTTSRTKGETADTLAAFEVMLRSLPRFRRVPIRMRDGRRADLDENMPYHAISIPLQSQLSASKVPILLELEVQRTFSNEGLEFYFAKLKLSLKASSSPENFMENRLGDGKAVELNDALIQARGTIHNPYWEIINSKNVRLHGRYVTRDAPLFLMKVQTAPATIETILAANVFDGSVHCPEFKDQASSNKENIIKILIANDEDTEQMNRGWLEISQQIVEIDRDPT